MRVATPNECTAVTHRFGRAAMLCSIYETKSNPPKIDVTLKLRTEKCRLCTTKNDKKAFVVQEVIFHTYYTRFYVSHLKRGEFSS